MKKFIIVISAMIMSILSYSQSEIDVTVKNTTNYEYIISIALNQSVLPTTGSLMFAVPANTSVTEHLEFDEYEVNVKSIKCYLDPPGNPIGFISINSGVNTQVNVEPWNGYSYNQFKFTGYYASGNYEHLSFEINQ